MRGLVAQSRAVNVNHQPPRRRNLKANQVDAADTASKPGSSNYIEVVADLVSAYVSNNSMRASDLPDFIASIHASIQQLAAGQVEAPPAPPPVPAVPIKKSLTQDHIICLEDGKKFRSLKRHLGTVYNMTPDEYRTKWGLPKDYPMVAPGYSEIRSKLAKDIGLGQQRSEAAAEAPEPTAEPEAPKTRGRKKAAA